MSDLIGQAKLATDTISRRKAIEVIESELDKMDHVPKWVFDRLTDRLRELPSAQPEPLTINFARELDRKTTEKLKESMKNAPVLIMAVQPERKDGRWIPCSDKMPMQGTEVLVCDKDGFLSIAEYELIDGEKWWRETTEYRHIEGVIAWMPLPEPYKGEE